MESRTTISGEQVSTGGLSNQAGTSQPLPPQNGAASGGTGVGIPSQGSPPAGVPRRGQGRQPARPLRPVAKVDMYTTRFSAECMQAKTIFDRKGVTYSEFIIDHDDESREVMLKRSGGRDSVPQIFINGRSIGGTEALQDLNASGELDVLLSQRPRDFVAEEAKAAKDAATDAGRSGGGRWNLFSRFGRP